MISVMLSHSGGTVHEYGTPEYNALIPAETRKPGSRAAIVVNVYQVGTVRTLLLLLWHTRRLLTVTYMFITVLRLRSPALRLFDAPYTAAQEF